MKLQTRHITTIKSSYLIIIIAILGVFAFISAALVAWPALAYLVSKLFG